MGNPIASATAAASKTPSTTPDLPPLFVLDTTARPPCPVREHEIIVGHEYGEPLLKSYQFKTGQRVEMPFEHAAQFLKGEGFVVSRDEEGRDIFELTPEGKDHAGRVVLKDHQVVANLSELTLESLHFRCSQLAVKLGETAPPKSAKKEKLVEYLTINAAKTRQSELAESEVDGETETMSDSEAAALLGENE